jgi:hypothetical protein
VHEKMRFPVHVPDLCSRVIPDSKSILFVLAMAVCESGERPPFSSTFEVLGC